MRAPACNAQAAHRGVAPAAKCPGTRPRGRLALEPPGRHSLAEPSFAGPSYAVGENPPASDSNSACDAEPAAERGTVSVITHTVPLAGTIRRHDVRVSVR